MRMIKETRNKFAAAAAACILLMIVLGCGSFRSGSSGDQPSAGSNRSTSDKVVDTTVGRTTVGIPECDEVLDTIETELASTEDNFIVKAAKATILNRFKDAIKQAAAENPADKEELAKTCREFKVQIDRALAEQKKNQ